MSKKSKKLIMCCPYCATTVGKTVAMEQGEIVCPGCGTILLINCKNSVLTVREGVAEYDAKK